MLSVGRTRIGAKDERLPFGTDENMYYVDNVPDGTQDEVHETLYKSIPPQNEVEGSCRAVL